MYHNNFMDIFIRFIIYGCFGLLMETVWTGLCSAFSGDKNLKCKTYLWMFPIYGMGVFLEPLHEAIRSFTWLYRGFIWAAVIFLIEFVTGYILKLTIGECPWDYDREIAIAAVTVKGLIRLDYLPVWFCVGLLFERMHDFVRIFI